MANERLDHAKQRLDAYYAAELAVLTGQEYYIGSRRLKRADLGEIRKTIKELENFVTELESIEAGKGRNKVFGIIPRDF